MNTSSHGQKRINENKKQKKLQGCGNEGKRKPYSMQPTLDTWRRRLNLMHYYISTSKYLQPLISSDTSTWREEGLCGWGVFFLEGRKIGMGKRFIQMLIIIRDSILLQLQKKKKKKRRE